MVRMVGVGAVCAALLLGACGDATPAASKPQSLEDVLGMDESAMQEREAKVQEAVRRCMREQGFDYVPADMSRMNVVRIGPGTGDNAEFRRTQGYGITTGLQAVSSADLAERGGSDPNDEIRQGLGEEDRKAYDTALFGAASVKEGPGGGFAIRVGPGPGGKAGSGDDEGPDLAGMGCFGKAQEEVGEPGRIRELGPKLQELQERIAADPRMVAANGTWSRCMGDAGYDFEKPEDIPPYLFGKLNELQGGPGGAGAAGGTGPVQPPSEGPELAALRAEELALAKADDGCSEETGRRDVARKVRAEAERRFLEENPDLAGDGAGGRG